MDKVAQLKTLFSDLPKTGASKLLMGDMPESAMAWALAETAKRHLGLVVAIAADSLMAAQLEHELQFFLNQEDIPILHFPDWETLPYDQFSPHQDILSERLMTLYRLPLLSRGVLILPLATAQHYLCPREYLQKYSLVVETGETLDRNALCQMFTKSGYQSVQQVMCHGEFALRGSLVDVFPMGATAPYRIDWWDNTIDSIRKIDIETQRSLEKQQRVAILPAREFPLTQDAIKSFKQRWLEVFDGEYTDSPWYRETAQGRPSPGLEYYLPVFFEKLATIFDYLPNHALMFRIEPLEKAGEDFFSFAKQRYENNRPIYKALLPPTALFLNVNTVFQHCNAYPSIVCSKDYLAKSALTHVHTLPKLMILPREENPLSALQNFLNGYNGRVLFCAETTGRREVQRELLQKIGLNPPLVESWQAFLDSNLPYGLAVAPLAQSFELRAYGIALIAEASLLGERVLQRRRRKKEREGFGENAVRHLAELQPGDAVVHLDHGVGLYQGLTRLDVGGLESEYVTLEYAGGDKLYVPVAALDVLSRYTGFGDNGPVLHRLGSEQWQKAKDKTLKQLRDVAAELLDIYARREAKLGFAFPPADSAYQAFSAEFPFEETPDQERSIMEVMQDLQRDRPMDRVICGDVGFGKTEVAMRAAFLVVQAGKQVVILVPTTLLAQQHYNTFQDRFSSFPIRIDVLSRFKNKKEEEKSLENLKNGQTDIIIGTHKLLQSALEFKALGLLIIDEEHRFGVKQKEQLKALRTDIDILTLTATPIPRTLNMSLAGIRDLSIIATPPLKRLSIKTFVRERDNSLIQEAISRELHRGGQVYFLHNSVETIQKTARELADLLPTALIEVAHGQMRERELEQVMSDFYHRRFNILVCTTIIETGIDIPSANTIIMDRADKLGLAQLHQLRGRVGRSHHQAYAFLLTPPKHSITGDAMKRLDAIAALEDLGAGFTLATQDLEIRGAGELLGEEQSGNIQAVGFTLYMELLESAVAALKAGKEPWTDTPLKSATEIELSLPALIPEDYLPDVQLRLVFYKRISHARDTEALDELKAEIWDRFGPLPVQVKYLFAITELRLQAQALGIRKIEAGLKGGRFEFTDKPNINPLQLIQLIQSKPNFRFEGPHRLRFTLEMPERELRLETVSLILKELAADH